MGRFTNPRDLYFGEGARHEVKNLKGKKAIIVSGGSSMRRGGFLQDVEADLKEGGFEVKLFEGVESDPSIETVMKGAEAMREFEPDWIIAIGGGSPIDAAKAMWVFYEYPEESFDNIIQPFSFPELRQKAHFCAISSTSGTATEVTAFSVITDYAKGIKYPLADFNITPDVAIVDPELTYTMPAKLCAHTGMDALTHAIEGYITKGHCTISDMFHLEAIKLISENLRGAVQNTPEGREGMALGQYIAGMGFSNVGLGIVHSMAHGLSALYDTPHGVACAILLPVGLEYNKTVAGERYRAVGKAMGVKGIDEMNDAQAADATIAAVKQLSADVGIPANLNGILKEEDIQFLAESAYADACRPGNPRDTSVEEIVELYKSQL